MTEIIVLPSSRVAPQSCGLGRTLIGFVAVLFATAGCASENESGDDTATTTITVAAVNNPQMEDLQKLLPAFRKDHPNIDVKIIFLPENQLRQEVTQAVATKSGRYDLFTIGTYETPIWAKNGWLENLQPFVEKTSSYDASDLIAGVATALSYQSNLYAVPFYGESSMLMYRKDLLAAAGLTLSEKPTWDEVAAAARAVHNPESGHSGICLRGLPGWGELMAPLNTVVHNFGARWYDLQWNPQLTAPEFKAAVTFYLDLLKDAGEPAAETFGFIECLKAYNEGKVAMWYDATVGASNFSGTIADNSDYAYAPTKLKAYSGWIWAWAFAMPATSENKDAAWAFASWATSKEYIKLVGSETGWNHVPPGTRTSTYQLPEYIQVARGYAEITLSSIANIDSTKPAVVPVPYTGVAPLNIAEFQDLGTQVSLEIAKVIVGRATVDEALQAAQQMAEEVGKKYR